MADLPWYKYFPTLFDADTALLTNQAVGGWQRLLNYMYPKSIDTIEGDLDFFSRIMRCQRQETRQILDELIGQEIADISENGKTVTLTSRKIWKANKKKENNKIRQQKFRRNANVTQQITPLSRKKNAQCNAPNNTSVTGENIDFRSKKLEDIKNIKNIYDFWNEKNIIQHREIEKHKPAIKAKLKNYSEAEITEAISNYKKILDGPEYWFSYQWTLTEFLQRGLDRFLTANNPFKNYKGRDGNKTKKPVDDCAEFVQTLPGTTKPIIKTKDINAEKLWAVAKRKIEETVEQEKFDTWIAPTVGYEFKGATLIIGVPNKLFPNWLQDQYSGLISEALEGREFSFEVVECG